MICGNTSDFIDHPYLKIFYLHMGPSTTSGPQAPHHLNPALSQPVVCVLLVVREGLPGGTRVTSIFTQKPGFTVFELRIGLCFEIIYFPVAC